MQQTTSYCFLFPGQGSQHQGMGKFLFDQFPSVQKLFRNASDAISFDLENLCFHGSDAELSLTENTQPALLLTSVATQRILANEFGIHPTLVAGHSVGEYAALVAAGVLDFEQAIKAVRKRGQSMQSAVPVGQGGMIAVLGLSEEQSEALCKWVTEKSELGPLAPANFNCPGQVVLSGSSAAIQWLQGNFKPEELPGAPKRAKLIPLNVSAPFHCEMMLPAENEMALFLNNTQFSDAKIPVIQNFTALAETKAEIIKQNLIRQISAPVLWTKSIERLTDMGQTEAIECGPSRVLTGLAKKIAGENLKMHNINSLEELMLFKSMAKN